MIELPTNRVLFSATDFDEANRALRACIDAGRASDDLDLIEVSEDGRRSLLVRGHESAVRMFIAESEGKAYRSFRTLAEAQAAPVATVIVEGDYGGQVFATCPARRVACSEERLHRLAEELETEVEGTDDTGGAQVLYEPLPIGAGVAGGMGGGGIVDGVWVHEEIRQLGWASAIAAILLGKQDDLPPPHPKVPLDVRAGILRAYDERIDVFCYIFGFPEPEYLRTMQVDEWQRRENAIVPPPSNYKRWYPATYRAIARDAGRGGAFPSPSGRGSG